MAYPNMPAPSLLSHLQPRQQSPQQPPSHRPQQPQPQALSSGSLADRFAKAHLKSLAENQPGRYRSLMSSPDRQEYLKNVGEQAESLYDRLMEPAMQESNHVKGSMEKVARLEAARLQAESEVMRSLVLVPDEETERAYREGGYR